MRQNTKPTGSTWHRPGQDLFARKRKKKCCFRDLLILTLTIMVFATGCGAGAKNLKLGGDLEEVPHYIGYALEQNVRIPYVDYDTILMEKKGEEEPIGRYADVTPDKQVNWKENKKFESDSSKIHASFEQITLNGETVKLPATFKDLGKEYEAFDKINPKGIAEKIPLLIKNKKNGYELRMDTEPKEAQGNYCANVIYNKKKLFGVWMKGNDDGMQIYSLDTDIDVDETYDLRIAGIGIGNTFNEAYEIFGKPQKVSFNRDTRSAYIRYEYQDSTTGWKDIVLFGHDSDIYDPREGTLKYARENVITDILVQRTK